MTGVHCFLQATFIAMMNFARLAVQTLGDLEVIWGHMLPQHHSAQQAVHEKNWSLQVTYEAS
jgi:hypothetical protein